MGDFVQGNFVWGDFVLGGILSRGILSRGILSGGVCRGGFCSRTGLSVDLPVFVYSNTKKTGLKFLMMFRPAFKMVRGLSTSNH